MSGLAAFGTALKRGATTVASVNSIAGGGIKLDLEDVTAHDSTSGFEESVATILRSSEIKVDINYDPDNATHKALIADMVAKTKVTDFTIVLPGGQIWAYAGAFVTGFEPSEPHNGKISASVTIKPSGVVTPPA
jgi:predicted secreted protein